MASMETTGPLPAAVVADEVGETLDQLARWAAFAFVAIVATAAAVVSYTHIYDLGVSHSAGDGTARLAARLLPVSVDGDILAASTVMLAAARRRVPAPALARWMLYAGIAATVAANVDYGARWGITGALLWALPAGAFCGGVELLATMVRLGTLAAAAVTELDAILREAIALYGEQLAAGEVPSVRAIRREMHVGQPRAKEIRGRLEQLAPAC